MDYYCCFFDSLKLVKYLKFKKIIVASHPTHHIYYLFNEILNYFIYLKK